MGRARKIIGWVGIGALWAVLSCAAAALAAPGLPITLPPGQWQPLEHWQDPGLQARLQQALQLRSGWAALLAQQKLAVGLVDLANPQAPRLALANGNTMLYAASLPKIVVLLAAVQGFADGSLPATAQNRALLTEMIRESSNPAAAALIQRLGLGKIQFLLFHPRYRFYDLRRGGGLWLGSTFSSAGERLPDPLKELYQAATAFQVCRFYYLLAYGRLINPQRSAQMLEVLSRPGLHDKFVSVLERTLPPDRLFRKNGTYGTTHCDSVLVWGEGWRRYILVGLAEDAQGEQILRELVPLAEGVLRQTPARKR